jgi:uncharacterized protein (TIGR03790 family)
MPVVRLVARYAARTEVRFRAVLVWAFALGFVASADAQTPANILVIANARSPISLQISSHYVKRRGIPSDQVIELQTATDDEISRDRFEREIQAPIASWLVKHSAQDRILYLVLTKGVPLRVSGTAGRFGTVSSVDSELTLLYRRLAGRSVPPGGAVPNPYFLGDRPVDSAARFSHSSHDIYLVTRLDGFSVDDVIALIDRAAAPVSTGRVLLDERASLSRSGNDWLAEAAQRLTAQGFGDRVTLDTTGRVLTNEKNVLGYYSWGSNDPAATKRVPDLQFVNGAIAAMFVSTDGRTFTEPPPTWNIGKWELRETHFAGSPQSLAGDLIRAGVTGVAAHVAEPFLDMTVRPNILFPAYFAGFNLAESFYLAMPSLSWQAVVVGDPLCAPFTKPALSSNELDVPIDPETELPKQFSAQRLAAFSDPRYNPLAVKRYVRAETRSSRGDTNGARESLEEAVLLDENLLLAWTMLANLYQTSGEFSSAIEAYRKIVDRDRSDVPALNNLAYLIAVKERKPQDALPFAERAHLLAPMNPMIKDTLGWIKHLLGDDTQAAPLIAAAAQALPQNAEVQLHAAVILVAAGRFEEGSKLLKIAERLDPGLKDNTDFKATLAKIAK